MTTQNFPGGSDQLLDHSYDGIQEFDNPTPGWWTLIFIGSVIFAGLYFIYYHGAPEGRTIREDYEQALAENLKQQFAGLGNLEPSRAKLLELQGKPELLLIGASVFKSNCVSCHGNEAQGLVGPNLTDEVYKNVRKIEDIIAVVSNGAANGAMPAWKTRLHPNEQVLVSAYVASLRGKNLPGPRGPEGEPIPAWK